MTIEQEIKLQVEARTKERLNELAKDIAKDMAQDIAKDMAQDMAQDIANEKTIETAKKMIAANLGTVEQIASVTGLSLEQVTKLKTSEN